MPEPATVTLVSTGFVAVALRYLQRKYQEIKPWFDRCLALALLALFWPLIAICAFLTRLTSRGPAFYRQERLGQDGRLFQIIKIRTMPVGIERGTGPVWAQGDEDPRATWFGGVLRRTHLDEMPQLINVLRGEMSFVGPRPERPYFVEHLRGEIPEYEARLSVKPGITGLAQVRAGYDREVRDVRRKVKLDLMYIERMCWLVDFAIMFRTLRKFSGRV